MTAVFIDGAQGTTGLEIRERLSGRADLELIELDETRRKDPSARAEALNAADIAILCLPDDAAREAVTLVDNSRTRIIDASSAHRVADGWAYGFPELGFDVASATRVSNPGCYPTGFLAFIAPLVRDGLLPADWPYSVNAISGYSGGGKALIGRFEEDEPTLGFRSYGLDLAHKHVPEMQRHAGLTHAPIFAPMVARAFRGMIVEVPLPLAAMQAASGDELRDHLKSFYANSVLIHVHDDAPAELTLAAAGEATDRLDLHVFASADGGQARLIARLDNLGKGAAGAAVQCLNLMSGAEEQTGLRL